MKDLLESLHIPEGPLPAFAGEAPSGLGEDRPRPPTEQRWRNKWLIAAPPTFALLLAGWARFMAPGALPVDVMTVLGNAGPAAQPPALVAGGYVKAARIVYVAPKVAGRISALRVREGDEVRAGQLIAEIEAQDLLQEALEGRAQVQSAILTKTRLERELQRTQALFGEGIVSSQALDQARTEFRVGEKNAEAATARMIHADNCLGYTKVVSPVAGRVVRKFRNVGDFVSPDVPFMEGYETVAVGSPVVSLADLGSQEVTADINETDFGKVTLQQRVEIVPNAFPELRLTGKVTQISPRADKNKNTVEVKAVIGPTDRILPYDLSVKISFLPQPRGGVEPAPALRIPLSALTERNGTRAVFVAEDSRATMRAVQVGEVREGQAVILSGLSPGDRLILSNPGDLGEGRRIKFK